MLAVQKSRTAADKCIPNILPCRIHHDGPAKVTKRYWTPVMEKDAFKTAYFRGRKLRGKQVGLPAGYQGMVLQDTEKTLPIHRRDGCGRPRIVRYDGGSSEDGNTNDDDDDDEDVTEPVRVAEQVASFDEFVVWGHDQIPASDDAFVKGIEEWLAFANAIHGSSEVSMQHQQQQQKLISEKD